MYIHIEWHGWVWICLSRGWIVYGHSSASHPRHATAKIALTLIFPRHMDYDRHTLHRKIYKIYAKTNSFLSRTFEAIILSIDFCFFFSKGGILVKVYLEGISNAKRMKVYSYWISQQNATPLELDYWPVASPRHEKGRTHEYRTKLGMTKVVLRGSWGCHHQILSWYTRKLLYIKINIHIRIPYRTIMTNTEHATRSNQ